MIYRGNQWVLPVAPWWSVLLFVVLLPFLLPVVVFASSSHVYTCADALRGSDGQYHYACAGDIFTFSSDGHFYDGDGNSGQYGTSPLFPLVTGSTYYFTFRGVGSGGVLVGGGGGGINCTGSVVSGSGDVIDASFVAGDFSYAGTMYQGQPCVVSQGYTGTVAQLCVSDTQGVCSLSSVGGGGGTSTTTQSVVGGATSTVDQAEQNVFLAAFLFLASMITMVWLMRKH